jgi:hypothetical protein
MFKTRPAHRPSSDLSVVLLLHVDSRKYLKPQLVDLCFPVHYSLPTDYLTLCNELPTASLHINYKISI